MTQQQIKNAIIFLDRVTLQGNEVAAFNECKDALLKEFKKTLPDTPKEEKKDEPKDKPAK